MVKQTTKNIWSFKKSANQQYQTTTYIVCIYVCMNDDKPLVLHLVTYTPPYLANDTITTITKFTKLPINKSQRVPTIIQHYDF